LSALRLVYCTMKTLFQKRQRTRRSTAQMPQVLIKMRTASRASILALVAVAALFGLTGVQKSLTNQVPFGPATLVEDHGPVVGIWRNLREQMVADDEAVSACLHDGVPDCAAAETLLHVIDDANAHQGKALIAYINRANQLADKTGSWRLGGGARSVYFCRR